MILATDIVVRYSEQQYRPEECGYVRIIHSRGNGYWEVEQGPEIRDCAKD